MTRLKNGRGPIQVPADFDFEDAMAEAQVLDAADIVIPDIIRRATEAGAFQKEQP